LGELANVVHHRAGAERAIHLVDVVARLEIAGLRVAARAFDALNRRRSQLASVELVDRLNQQTGIVREVLRRVGTSGVDNRGEIVGAEVLFNESARGSLDARRSGEVGMNVVEDQ